MSWQRHHHHHDVITDDTSNHHDDASPASGPAVTDTDGHHVGGMAHDLSVGGSDRLQDLQFERRACVVNEDRTVMNGDGRIRHINGLTRLQSLTSNEYFAPCRS